jgi:N-acetylmuramoyl-L-alanine amidase
MSKYTYILDNGHGEETKLKESPEWNDGSKLYEYQFNRAVVKLLSFMLRQAKIDCKILVPEETDISLSERVKRANGIPNSIFISVHGNQYTSEKVHGLETHYYKAGYKIAQVFQKHLGKLGKNRGVKQSNFYVIKNTNMPAILTENGFYSNEKECKKMLSQDFQYEIANAHYKAIKEIENAR